MYTESLRSEILVVVYEWVEEIYLFCSFLLIVGIISHFRQKNVRPVVLPLLQVLLFNPSSLLLFLPFHHF